MSKKKTIVIAWVEEVQVPDGRPFARDLGALPGMSTERVGRACVWLLKGTSDDLIKASAFVRTDHPGGFVFEYPTTERDPLARARKDALEQKQKKIPEKLDS